MDVRIYLFCIRGYMILMMVNDLCATEFGSEHKPFTMDGGEYQTSENAFCGYSLDMKVSVSFWCIRSMIQKH